MAYKSIKKGKGKRKGGKKSNRRTYKQRGGVNMQMLVMLTIGMLATLNIIYRLPDEQTSHLRGIQKTDNVQAGPYYLGIEDSNGSEVQTVFDVAQAASHLRNEVTNNYPLIKNPVVVTEEYLKTIIEENIDGVVDKTRLTNEVLANLPIDSVIKDGTHPSDTHFYVIAKETLNGMTKNLEKTIGERKLVQIEA